MCVRAAILLSAAYLFAGIGCWAQNPCSARYNTNPNEKPLTSAALAHRALLRTPSEEWRDFTLGDVEFILRCGTQQDADRLFAALHNTSTQMADAAVLEANQNLVRVAWNDGFHPHLGEFWFTFDNPLAVTPHPGEKVVISGTYSSYSRMPFQINMTNSSFIVYTNLLGAFLPVESHRVIPELASSR